MMMAAGWLTSALPWVPCLLGSLPWVWLFLQKRAHEDEITYYGRQDDVLVQLELPVAMAVAAGRLLQAPSHS